MCTNTTSGRLRITQAFMALSGTPEGNSAPRTISVIKIGSHEIRMSNGSSRGPGDVPLLWMELFDHDARISVDSCSCIEIDDAVSAFDEFVAQTKSDGESRAGN